MCEEGGGDEGSHGWEMRVVSRGEKDGLGRDVHA